MKTKVAMLLSVIFMAVVLALGCMKNATNESRKNPPAAQGGSELAPVVKSGEHENFKILEKRLTAEDIAECKQVIERYFEALRTHNFELYNSAVADGWKVKSGDPQVLRIKEAKVYRINENPRWFNLESIQEGGAGISRLSGKTWYKLPY